MTPNPTPLKTLNFICGFALLAMVFPSADRPVEKPAGVRNAIELAAKKSYALSSTISRYGI